MQSGGARGGEDGCKDQGSPSAAGLRGRDWDAPSASPPFPSPDLSSSKMKHGDEQQHPTGSLPEGALVEILSRVPYRSLCRFKCVSKPWLALCSATDIRRRSPQTLSGFFSLGIHGLQFRNLSGRGPPMVDPSLPFLRESYGSIWVRQCCTSLLLCECWKSTPDGIAACDYVVCNPATEKWTVLPPVVLEGQENNHLFTLDHNTVFLGFDTATPSRFVVFVVSSYCDECVEIVIYSSETGRWTSVPSEWGYKTILLRHQGCVFLNGTMHFTTLHSSLVTVDVEGKVWRKIELPDSTPGSFDAALASIGQSQGRLHAWRINYDHGCQLYVWVLEDYDSGKWSLKHTINVLELFGRHRRKDTESYKMFAIHPECNLIFLTDKKKTTMSYDMDNQKVHVICTSGEFLGGLPYTPWFAEWPSVGQ